MAKQTQAIPQGYHSVTPSLMVAGAAQAIEFYRKAFGAEEKSRFLGPDGSIMHATIQIGNSILMLGDEMPGQGMQGPRRLGGSPVAFFIYQEGVDQAWARATEAGAKVVMPLANQFWGDRCGCLEDPFGHRWWLAERVKDLSDPELRDAAAAFFASAG